MYARKFNAPEEDMSEICQSWHQRDCAKHVVTPENFAEICPSLEQSSSDDMKSEI